MNFQTPKPAIAIIYRRMFLKSILTSILFLTSLLSAKAQSIPPPTGALSNDHNAFVANQMHYYDSTGLDTIKGSGYKDFLRWSKLWNDKTGDSINHGS